MKTAIQELIHFIEKDKMQSTYTKEQILELLNFKLETEKEQSHYYAKFAIQCDRKDIKILNFEDFIKL